MSGTNKAKRGDDVIVNYENQDLTARVKSVQASGKVDCLITARGKFFGKVITFDPGGVKPIGGASDVESLRNEANQGGPAVSASELHAVHVHIDAAIGDARSAFNERLSELEDRVAVLESKKSNAKP